MTILRLTFCVATLVVFSSCASSKQAASEDTIPHSNYGGCQIKGKHYHNTHVFIGDVYQRSLSEWLKY